MEIKLNKNHYPYDSRNFSIFNRFIGTSASAKNATVYELMVRIIKW